MRFLNLFAAMVLCNSLAIPVFAADTPDTYGNRLAAARRYLDVASMKDMMRDMTQETAKNLPENLRQPFIQYMNKSIRIEVLESTALASMAKHFTYKELDAIASFYGSPEGRSAMKKFGAYMGDVMPVLQQEMLRSQQQFEDQLKQRK